MLARSSSIARTISRGNAGPTPAAWLIRRFSWSWPGLGRLDERGREVAEAGRHAVHDGTLGDERLDDVARLLHPLPRVRVELDRRAAAGDGLHVGDREVRAGQDDLRFGHVAEDSRLCSRPCSTS